MFPRPANSATGWTPRIARASMVRRVAPRTPLLPFSWGPARPGAMATEPLSSPSETDRGLLERIAGGDETGLARLYDRYAGALYAVAWRISGERGDAEEIVLDAFAQAWREAGRFRAERGSVIAWPESRARPGARAGTPDPGRLRRRPGAGCPARHGHRRSGAGRGAGAR